MNPKSPEPTESAITTVEELGKIVLATRKSQGLTQADIAGLSNSGNRFIVDLEKGKPTLQMQKALEVLALLGLELVVRRKDNK
jgi:HTH-type transcriptional regulator/antitoxin HipB